MLLSFYFSLFAGTTTFFLSLPLKHTHIHTLSSTIRLKRNTIGGGAWGWGRMRTWPRPTKHYFFTSGIRRVTVCARQIAFINTSFFAMIPFIYTKYKPITLTLLWQLIVCTCVSVNVMVKASQRATNVRILSSSSPCASSVKYNWMFRAVFRVVMTRCSPLTLGLVPSTSMRSFSP